MHDNVPFNPGKEAYEKLASPEVSIHIEFGTPLVRLEHTDESLASKFTIWPFYDGSPDTVTAKLGNLRDRYIFLYKDIAFSVAIAFVEQRSSNH